MKSFEKNQFGFRGPWFEKLDNKEGIFEFKERDSEKFYRIFAFWDTENETISLILGTHGLDKKTNKTPKLDLIRASKIKIEYFKYKDNNK